VTNAGNDMAGAGIAMMSAGNTVDGTGTTIARTADSGPHLTQGCSQFSVW
jgi:hypothetical protein